MMKAGVLHFTYVLLMLTSTMASTSDSSATCAAGDDCANAEAQASSLLQKSNLATQLPVEVDEEEPGQPKVSWTSMEQNVAEQRDQARVRLGIEGDLRRFQSKMRAWKEDEDCETNARKAYAQGLEAAGLAAELTEEEQENFETRFVEEMIADCKYDPDIWSLYSQSAS